MKQVIFVCLLTLSVCLGQTSQQQPASPPIAAAPSVTATTEKAPEKPDHAAQTTTETATKVTASVSPAQTTQKSTAPANTTVVPANETASETNETKPADKDNTTGAKPVTDPPKTAQEKTPVPPKHETKPAVPADNVKNGTSADNKDGKKNETTTPKSVIVKTTTTEAPVQAKSRAFDGPSFIGGIILALGLLAVGFMGFKYYKNQTERNYHTL